MAIHLQTVGQEQLCENRSQFKNVTDILTNRRTDTARCSRVSATITMNNIFIVSVKKKELIRQSSVGQNSHIPLLFIVYVTKNLFALAMSVRSV